MEEAESVMKIFDRCWLELEIFKKRPDTSPSSTSGSDPGQQSIGGIPEDEIPCIHLSRAPSILVRSMSDQTSIIPTSFPSSSLSPDSVLCTTPMHSMIYEEEEGFNWNNPRSSEFSQGKKGRAGGRAKRRSLSKSLSQLEFEELKGFMDLGFVFSEEDIDDSSLVSIIPGLQRLGKRIKDANHRQEDGDEKERVGESAGIARPYLSEAWEWWEEEDPLMNWKVPALANDTDMRESLKWWAHTVASTVT
ncbi:uncharacterized protein LOC125314333 isoform X3 [Rhodamnia argentea]|uniref:Uncharacterized protein LOC125314333 isoform X3 n=1 Tax=Rhodamnia argentea TaxID=178133 RepID=A0ABM3H6V1_9MYRT|nr:uncharacterized protein LOC125314333 isoform X3 [Rhodamnia argentea]